MKISKISIVSMVASLIVGLTAVVPVYAQVSATNVVYTGGISSATSMNMNATTNAAKSSPHKRQNTLGTSYAAGVHAGIGANGTTTLSTSAQAKVLANGISRGDQEITRRITSLNALLTRISQMVKVSVSEKTGLNTEIQTQIKTLTTLKAKIDADTDLPTLKTDLQSITSSYRIYALVLPQTEILAAADRMGTIVDAMNVLGSKIQSAITSAQAGGGNVVIPSAAFSDYGVKVADATTQYQTAGNTVAILVPDNGDTTVAQSNHQSLLNARADIKTGTQDLLAARKDAATIVAALKALHVNISSSASASTSSTGSTVSTQ
jgi:hypothetical protein